MKKLYAIILAVVMIISLFGCANGNDPVGTTDNTVNTEATIGEHDHDHGDETIGSTEGTTEATEDTTTPTDAETIPDSPDDIGNGGVEDDPAKNMTEPTQPAPTEPVETKHEHNYTSKVTNPTCESKGYTTYTCSCGDSYTGNETKATGHDYTSKTVAPTCGSDGYTKHTCTKCNKSYTDGKTSATGNHNYTTKTVAPTTEAEGYDIHTCSVCGKSYKDNYTDKLPSDNSGSDDGDTGYYWGRDGFEKVKVYHDCATQGHVADGKGTVIQEMTCCQHQITQYTCKVIGCGVVYTSEGTGYTNHTMSEEDKAKETQGEKVYKAKCICGLIYTDADYDTAVADCHAHIEMAGGESNEHKFEQVWEYYEKVHPDFP